MLFKLVARSIRYRLNLYVPMLTAITITLFLIGAAHLVDRSFNDVIEREMQKYGANVILRPSSGETVNEGVPVQVRKATVDGQQLKLGTTNISSLLKINPAWVKQGEGKYLVGEQAASRLDIKPGSPVTIEGKKAQAALLKTGTRFDSYIFREGEVNQVSVRLIRTDHPERYESRNAVILREMVQSKYEVLQSVDSLMFIVAIISVFASFATVINLARIDAGRRRREFGIFKSLGASERTIALQMLIEYLALAAISTAAGIGGSFVLGWAILHYVASYTPSMDMAGLIYISLIPLFAFGLAGLIYIVESRRHPVVDDISGI